MPILTDSERLQTTISGGKYTLERILGRGGMGTVFEGVHTWTGRRVAIKLLRHDLATDEDASRRYLQEARAATAVEHPNVVDVLDMGRDDETTVYMVFELLRGRSLGDLLDEQVRLPPMETAMILLPIADAVAAAHRIGIVHRDIKPDNIFLEDDGMGCIRPKLLDFGIARITDPLRGVSRTEVVTGTPEYMSPEHARGHRAAPAADVWSLGVVLYECLVGSRPFDSDSAVEVLMALMSAPIPSLRDRDDVPPALAELVDRSLVREVERRLPDGEAFRDELARAVGLECVPSRSRSVPPKLLSVTGEVGLSADRRIVARRSTPSLERALGFDSNPPSGEMSRAVTAAPSGQERLSDPVDRSTPTRDSLHESEARSTPIVVPAARSSRRPLYAGLALLVVGLVAGGVTALVMVGANRGEPSSASSQPTPPSPSRAPSPEMVAATPDPVAVPVASSPPAPGSNVGTRAAADPSEGARALGNRARSASVEPSPAAASTSPPGPTISERRRVTAPPRARDPERGANGSLILD